MSHFAVHMSLRTNTLKAAPPPFCSFPQCSSQHLVDPPGGSQPFRALWPDAGQTDSPVLFSPGHPMTIKHVTAFIRCQRRKLVQVQCSALHGQPLQGSASPFCTPCPTAQGGSLSTGFGSSSGRLVTLGTTWGATSSGSRGDHRMRRMEAVYHKHIPPCLQHLDPEMATGRAFTRGSNYADADLQE